MGIEEHIEQTKRAMDRLVEKCPDELAFCGTLSIYLEPKMQPTIDVRYKVLPQKEPKE
jgi:hypothetical protein